MLGHPKDFVNMSKALNNCMFHSLELDRIVHSEPLSNDLIYAFCQVYGYTDLSEDLLKVDAHGNVLYVNPQLRRDILKLLAEFDYPSYLSIQIMGPAWRFLAANELAKLTDHQLETEIYNDASHPDRLAIIQNGGRDALAREIAYSDCLIYPEDIHPLLNKLNLRVEASNQFPADRQWFQTHGSENPTRTLQLVSPDGVDGHASKHWYLQIPATRMTQPHVKKLMQQHAKMQHLGTALRELDEKVVIDENRRPAPRSSRQWEEQSAARDLAYQRQLEQLRNKLYSEQFPLDDDLSAQSLQAARLNFEPYSYQVAAQELSTLVRSTVDMMGHRDEASAHARKRPHVDSNPTSAAKPAATKHRRSMAPAARKVQFDVPAASTPVVQSITQFNAQMSKVDDRNANTGNIIKAIKDAPLFAAIPEKEKARYFANMHKALVAIVSKQHHMIQAPAAKNEEQQQKVAKHVDRLKRKLLSGDFNRELQAATRTLNSGVSEETQQVAADHKLAIELQLEEIASAIKYHKP